MNLSCQQQGANRQYLKLCALMQQTFHYCIKHAQVLSTGFNQHSDANPWYGAGQGASDACLRWVVQADIIIKAYASKQNLGICIPPTMTFTTVNSWMPSLTTWTFLQQATPSEFSYNTAVKHKPLA